MRHDRRNDANQIDVITRDDDAPIVFDVRNSEFARDFFGMFAMRAGDGDNLRAFAILECGNLRRARKTRSDNSNADCFCDFFLPQCRANLLACCYCPAAYCLLIF